MPDIGTQAVGTTIRARVPLRLGLAGGGTDLSPYCDEFGGAVLNLTIDRYAYAIIEPSPDGRVHFIAPDLNVIETFPPVMAAIESSRLPLHAGVMTRMLKQFGGGAVPPIRVTSLRRIAVIQGLNDLGGTAGGVHFTQNGAESWSV